MSISQSVRASKIYIDIFGKMTSLASLFIPARGLLIGQYDAAKTSVTNYTAAQATDADDVAFKYGFGSVLHRMALRLPPAVFNQGGGIWCAPIPEASAGSQADMNVTLSGTATTAGTLPFLISGTRVQVPVAIGDTADAVGEAMDAAVAAIASLPVTSSNTSGTVDVEAKPKGTLGNQIEIVLNPNGASDLALNPAGITVTLENSDGYLSGGATDPSIHDALLDSTQNDVLGKRWYTDIICAYNDATNIGYLKTSLALRFDNTFVRMAGAFIGYVKDLYATALTIPATINSKWITTIWDARCQAPTFELAANVGGLVLNRKNENPFRSYKNLELSVPFDATVSDPLDAKNDALFRAGMSYVKVGTDGTARIGDLALTYRTNPAGGATEEWFAAEELGNRQEKAYSIEQLFLSDEYQTANVVSDSDNPTGIDFAIAPKDVVSALAKLVDELWGAYGGTKNVEDVIESITASINSTYGSRIDAAFLDDEAKALRILAVSYAFKY